MRKKELLDLIYGLILFSNFDVATEVHSMINDQWNNDPFHKKLYQVITESIDDQENPDLVSVVLAFKKHSWYNSKIPQKLSLLTSQIPSDSLLTIRKTIADLEYIRQVETANNAMSEIKGFIDSENFDPSKFVEIVDDAKDAMIVSKTKEISNSEALLDVIEQHNKAKIGEMKGVDLGFHVLKGRVFLEEVDVMIIGARPGMGKTAFGVQLCVNMGIRQGLNVAYFALEMSRTQMMRRLAANLSGVDSNRIKFGEMNEHESKRVYDIQTIEELGNVKFFDTSKDLREIRMNLSEMKMQQGLDVVIIDYIQKIDEKGGNNLHEKVSKISDGVKRIAQNLKVPVIAFAQLSRSVENRGGDKIPILSDLKESGDIEQDASIVGFLWRPSYYGFMQDEMGNDTSNICKLIIAKNREGEQGSYDFMIDLKTSKLF